MLAQPPGLEFRERRLTTPAKLRRDRQEPGTRITRVLLVRVCVGLSLE
jgi:hypothetical protein